MRYTFFRPPSAMMPPPSVPSIQPPSVVFSAGSRPSGGPAAIAVGNFDGVHLGHAAIVGRLVELAGRLGVPTGVLTFDPHPARILRPESAPIPLTTPGRRAELLAALGVDEVLVQPVDADFVALQAEAFYGDVLRGRLQAAGLVEGGDFQFGAGRRGDVALLSRLCAADGIPLEIVEPVARDGESVSSSRLRSLVAAGRIREAASMLTADYRIRGTVIEGARRGRTIGFPTANLAGIATLLPADGVYAARALIAGQNPLPAAVHIGPNVSFGETATSVEVHIIGWSGNLYGSALDVDFLDRLRETRRFASVDEVKAQLTLDVALASSIATAT